MTEASEMRWWSHFATQRAPGLVHGGIPAGLHLQPQYATVFIAQAVRDAAAANSFGGDQA